MFTPSVRSLLSAGFAAALVIAVAALWLTRDQRQINGNLNRLRKLVSKSEDEKTLGELIRAKEITGYFAAPVDVKLGAPGLNFKDPDELAVAIHYARNLAKTIQINIRNKRLTINPARTSAMMTMAVDVIVTLDGQTNQDAQELCLIWVKQQGQWLISKVESTETIRRPPGLGNMFF
jgi:hypothetical protein